MNSKFNNNDLKKQGVDEKYWLFCQVWTELTNKKTFDSYQYKSLNTINGIQELIHNLENYLNNTGMSVHSVKSVGEELAKHIKRDYVLKKYFVNIKNRMLETLNKERQKNSDYKTLLYNLKIYQKELTKETEQGNYDKCLIESIVESINNESINNKTEITITLVANYISRCVDKGWSDIALHIKPNQLSETSINDFLSKILGVEDQNYIVLFPLDNTLNMLKPSREDYISCWKFKSDNIKVQAFGNIKKDYEELNSDIPDDSKVFVINSNAKDVYTASHNAILTLSNAFNTLNFFSIYEYWTINSNKTWLVYNTDSPYLKEVDISTLYNTYEYLADSSFVRRKIEDLIKNTNSQELKNKLHSAFKYASMSHISITVEEKFMNMWIALESLTRINTYNSIISNIKDVISNACCLRLIYRTIRNFIEDCIRCNVSLRFETIKISTSNLKKEPRKEPIVKDMISLIRSNEYDELYQRCTCNSLLKYRCNEIHEMLTNEKVLIETIRSHHKTLEWHLDRLYRIRNEIAHSAASQSVSVVKYTEHLYDYVATFVSEIANFSYKKNVSEFSDIITYINDNYSEFTYIARSKTQNKAELLGDLWITGEMNFI